MQRFYEAMGCFGSADSLCRQMMPRMSQKEAKGSDWIRHHLGLA